MYKLSSLLVGMSIFVFSSCGEVDNNIVEREKLKINIDTVAVNPEPKLTLSDINIELGLLYDKYTLDDIYPYKDTTRRFQWNKIRNLLFFVDSIQQEPALWATLQNYKNRNGEAPLIKEYERNAYGNISDKYGVQRRQSVPLYSLNDTIKPERYSNDGSLVKYIGDYGSFIKAEHVWFGGEWYIPKKYVKHLVDSAVFDKVAFVDVVNQNITTLEKSGVDWLVRSKNPATTGLRRPPYQHETPVGLFVFQEKKPKMFYLVDGTNNIGGYSPFASRFSNGGYIHGVPVNLPRTTDIEWSNTLGTTPRSHMCVRNATSHAEFLYNWIRVGESLLFVIE
ncbi:hypothetical protein M2138_000379 [Dysgonomonadaceae bacterium PH5-43]|nr:hypothetical protein [Dysgonomonadaceae bacterium PH5-43]